jgi:hypothetical protein
VASAETRPIWTATDDTYIGPMIGTVRRPQPNGTNDEPTLQNHQVTVWRWREDFQNDFAARMLWTTKRYDEANHPPVAVLALDTPAEFSMHSGQDFHLDAKGSYDADDSYYWFEYVEAGDLPERINLSPFSQALSNLPVTAPKVESRRPYISFFASEIKEHPPCLVTGG